MDSATVIRAVTCWVREVVVGLQLCPFAATPLNTGRIRFVVCGASQTDAIYRALLAELEMLLTLPEQQAETGLFIVPRGLDAFDDYLDLLYAAEEAIAAVGLDELVQLASFHPDYRFAGATPEDPANFTNRSPYPMFHLIRQEPMRRALERYPHPEQIPLRNIETLRRLGLQEVRRLLDSCRGGGA